MIELHRGSSGQVVGQWQAFLQRMGYDAGAVDGVFGEQTSRATRSFQSARRLTADGVVGPATLRAATVLGFELPIEATPSAPARIEPAGAPNAFYPARPNFAPLASDADRQRIFGKFAYRAAPTEDNPEAIVVTDDWAHSNIVPVSVPGLAGIPYGWGGTTSGKVSFHRKAAPQLINLWQAWRDAGLLDRVLTFDGAYVSRFVRRSHSVLSNHAFGSAFDLNAHWNGYGRPAARVGEKGSLLELVPLANQWGFYWGGHFSGRADGMHFEIAKLL